MRLEQSGQSVGLFRHYRRGARGGLFAHTLLNVWRVQNVGARDSLARAAPDDGHETGRQVLVAERGTEGRVDTVLSKQSRNV